MNYEKTLHIVYENPAIMEALENLFLEVAGQASPKVSGQDDETLGQEYRAYCKAKEIIGDTILRLHSMESADGGGGSIKYK